MSWKTVKTRVCGPRPRQDDGGAGHASIKAIDAAASKFRVNILHNAEKLVNSVPKRKRRASRSAIAEPTSKKSKSSTSSKKKIAAAQTAEPGSEEKPASSKRRSVRLETPCTEGSGEVQGTKQLAAKFDASKATLEPSWQSATRNGPVYSNIEHDYTEPVPVHEFPVPTPPLRPAVEVKASSVDRVLQQTLDELSSDEASTKFGDFDDSVFDEPLQAGLGVNSSPSSLTSPATSTSATSPKIPAPKDTASGNPQPSPMTTVRDKHARPNGAPIVPFMHPCLLDSLEAEAIALNKKGASTPSFKHTCFRAAELLRLTKNFLSSSDAQENDLTAELYITVKEVKYANSQGQGQGLVLADVFFPDKPPFISASTRIPYNAKDLIPPSQGLGGTKSPMKATIKISGPRPAPLEVPMLSNPPSGKVCQSTPQSSSLTPSTHEIEVTDVHTSS